MTRTAPAAMGTTATTVATAFDSSPTRDWPGFNSASDSMVGPKPKQASGPYEHRSRAIGLPAIAIESGEEAYHTLAPKHRLIKSPLSLHRPRSWAVRLTQTVLSGGKGLSGVMLARFVVHIRRPA